MRHFAAVVLAVIVLGRVEADSSAQATNGWVGQRVITKFGTVLKVGNQVVDDEGLSRSNAFDGHCRRSSRAYRVEQVNGPWLWLVAEKGGARGWARVEQVIPFDQAIDDFTRQLQARPSAALYISRGNLWHKRSMYDTAIADYTEAIRLDPTASVGYVNRGIAWYDKRDYDKAVADHTEAIGRDPLFADAYTNRGNAWQAKGEYDRAIADYDLAIRLNPRDAHAYNNRAWLWATCPDAKYRDGKRAVESATRACELTGEKDASKLDTLAAAYAEAGDFDAAVTWQEKAMGLLPTDAEGARGVYGSRLALYREKEPYRE